MTPARPRNAPRGDADAERWLVPCAEAAVLEVVEQTWQFAHDKLRERLLEDVDSAARRGLHAQVARGIVASRTELAPFSAPLAYHYREDAEPAHAAHYDLLAGEQALKEGALQTTVIHLRQALDYYDTHGGELLLRVRRRRQLSEACYALGQVDDCIAHFKPGRALLGRPYPEAGPRRWLRTAAEAGVQAVHALVPWLAPKSRLGRAQLQELIALNHAAEEAFIWHGQDSGPCSAASKR